VVVADPLADGGLQLLRSQLEVLLPPDESSLRDAVPSSDALIVRSRTRVTSDLLEGARRLRLVARAGIGVDNIDVDAATERGILVVNAPLGNVRSTAEHTMALIFALARRVTAADRAARDGTWKTGYEGMQLAGKRLGVIGVGKIGRQVAAMASALGMEILAHDPYLPATAWPDLGLRPVPFDELLSEADIVTLHVPLLPETRGLIGAAEISRMKPGAYLVNCARGGLVDEAELADALASGRLAGAALDVFEREPVRDSPLLAAPNLILTPHVAASTKEAQAQVSTDVALAVLDFFAGKPPAFPVNPSVLGA
jgi:D-3-phosphoglycerate dehydrogenase